MGINNKLLKHENRLKEYVKDKYGDQFDVSKIKFKRSVERVILICKDHGEFSITPNNIRISKYLCIKCAYIAGAKNKTRTTEQFKVEAKIIHGDRYIYDLVDYKHIEIPVDIICKIHGPFKQTPHSHLKGNNCFKCSREVAIEKTKLTPEIYFERANLKHNYKFDYTNSIYLGTVYPITYICPKHGEVTQNASGHLAYGCERCGHDVKVVPFEEFVERALVKHKGLYTYLKEGYTNISSKIKCVCKIHGIFEQVGDDHLKGTGCPICSSSKNEQRIYDLLTRHNFNFIKEFKFKDSKLRYDFYLIDLNLLIEYDGPQHFLAVPMWGDVEGLAKRRKNDFIKNEMAKQANIPLKRFDYKIAYDIEVGVINFITEHYPYNYENKFFKTLEELKEYLDILEIVVSDNIVTYKTETNLARYSSNTIMKPF